MNCIIFTGGKFPADQKTVQTLKQQSSTDTIVIAADSGLNTAMHYNIKADYFLGDMDSVSQKAVDWFNKNSRNQNTDYFPVDKDFSDTELALKKAKELDASKITLVGGSGGRLDHFLGILELYKQDFAPDLWLTEENAVYLLDATKNSKLSFNNFSLNEPVSIFPVFLHSSADRKYCCRSKGLKWQLDNLDWNAGTVSLSNRRAENKSTIELFAECGRFIVIVPIEKFLS